MSAVPARARSAPRTRPTRAETRARLLDAAGRVFARRGYERATLDDVAADAGLTKGAVYSSFSGKDDLFFALMETRIEERLALVARAVGEHDPAAGLRAAGADLGRLSADQDDWHLLFVEFWARAARDPQLRSVFADHRRRARQLVARFVEERATHAGVTLPVPADQLALTLLALSNGIAIERLADPEQVDASAFEAALTLLLEPQLRPR